MEEYLLLGILLGLSAGFSPGPLTLLVVSETLRQDLRAGMTVAIAPLITDLPIVILTLLILGQLADFHLVLGLISMGGGGFILYLGVGAMVTKPLCIDQASATSGSLTKGVVTNFLSPHPYLFWFSVGAPTVTKALQVDALQAILFVASFYFCLLGSKLGIAWLTASARSFLTGRGYLYTMRILGLLLIGLSALVVSDGLVLIRGA